MGQGARVTWVAYNTVRSCCHQFVIFADGDFEGEELFQGAIALEAYETPANDEKHARYGQVREPQIFLSANLHDCRSEGLGRGW